MAVEIVRTIDEGEWRSYVDNHPQGNIYHTPEMFQVFEKTEGYTPHLWAAKTSDNNLAALMIPVNITLSPRLSKLTTRAVVFGSILCDSRPEGDKALSLLLQEYRREERHKVLFTEFRNLSNLENIQPILNASGFTFEDHLNFLVDLTQSEESLWNSIKKSGRQSIRTSRNKGTIVEECKEKSKVRVAYQLLKQVYASVQVPLAGPSLFESAFDILGPKNMFRILLARADSRYIGAVLLLLHKGRMIDWYAGSDREFSAHAPSELLIWHALEWGGRNDFQIFDFGGAGKPSEEYGPRKFKEKFGGRRVNYGRNICVHSPLKLKLSRAGYKVLRRFL